jgi:hypothetical protein
MYIEYFLLQIFVFICSHLGTSMTLSLHLTINLGINKFFYSQYHLTNLKVSMDGLCMSVKPELGAWSLKFNVILIHLHG